MLEQFRTRVQRDLRQTGGDLFPSMFVSKLSQTFFTSIFMTKMQSFSIPCFLSIRVDLNYFYPLFAYIVPEFLRNAWKVLKSGGLLVIHDFMVEDAKDGPLLGALWALQHVTVNPKGLGLTPQAVAERMKSVGFQEVRVFAARKTVFFEGWASSVILYYVVKKRLAIECVCVFETLFTSSFRESGENLSKHQWTNVICRKVEHFDLIARMTKVVMARKPWPLHGISTWHSMGFCCLSSQEMGQAVQLKSAQRLTLRIVLKDVGFTQQECVLCWKGARLLAGGSYQDHFQVLSGSPIWRHPRIGFASEQLRHSFLQKEMPVYKSFHKPTCFGHQMAAGSIFPIYRIRRMDHRSIHPATMSGSDEPADNVVSLRGDVDLGFLYNPATWHQNFHWSLLVVFCSCLCVML